MGVDFMEGPTLIMSKSFTFVDATKAGCKARIALSGIAGSGKTWTALKIAGGLDRGDQSLGIIDSDRQSARKYADVFAFKWIGMTTFDPEDLIRATIAAAEQNVGTLIVDTWSPFWSGTDGMLDRVGRAQSNFEGWRQMRPVERDMFNALLGYPGHVIVTLRSKTEYVVETNEKGRAEPRRVGLKPDQRDGVEHEFDVFLSLEDAGAIARVDKTRCPELAGQSFRHPDEKVGETIQAWLDRDAVGEMLNPHTIRDWAIDETDRMVLGERFRALEDAGQLGAMVYERDGEKLTSIGSLLEERGRTLLKAEKQASAAADAERVRAERFAARQRQQAGPQEQEGPGEAGPATDTATAGAAAE